MRISRRRGFAGCDSETAKSTAPTKPSLLTHFRKDAPMADDWKKSLPFPAHWLSYLGFKVAVLALASLLALHLLGYL